MEKVITSKRFSLKTRDFIKGALMAVVIPCLLVIQQSIDNGEWSFNWKLIAMTAIGSFVGYIIKNFTDSPKVVITAKDNKAAENLKRKLE